MSDTPSKEQGREKYTLKFPHKFKGKRYKAGAVFKGTREDVAFLKKRDTEQAVPDSDNPKSGGGE